MIPPLVSMKGAPWAVLPPGIHLASFADIHAAFAFNEKRRRLFSGLTAGARDLAEAGCRRLFVDGSFVSGKPFPGDFDACWDSQGVDLTKLNPVFKDFAHDRTQQKATFGGEFFPSTMIVREASAPFNEFFQCDKHSGGRKGILEVRIDIKTNHLGGPRDP